MASSPAAAGDTVEEKHSSRSASAAVDGVCASFLSLGAIIQSFSVVDTTNSNRNINIVQNFATPEEYHKFNVPYFGETIGRVANRISGAKLSDINGGKSYTLDANDGANCLHGGLAGWGKREWMLDGPSTAVNEKGEEVVRCQFTRRSEDGECGFPGTVDVAVNYTTYMEKHHDGRVVSVLEIEYDAELVDAAEETVVAMTNHSYFNLNGANTTSTIQDTRVTLSTNQYLPVDTANIPTGPIESFPNITPNTPFTLGAKEPDIDHCFLLNTTPKSITTDTRAQSLQKLASFHHPQSGVHLEVHSTEPAFQFYTGKYIDVPAVGNIPARGARTGFCVEPSRYVNAVNVDDWRGMVVLRRGEKYGARIVYRAWKDGKAPK